MGDVNLGTVKATLEFDTAAAQAGADKLTSALKLTQEQIIALANASETQRVKMLAAFEAAAKGADTAAQSTVAWTEKQQRAAMAMSASQDAANKMNAALLAAAKGEEQAAKGAEGLGKEIDKARGFFDGFSDSLKRGLGFGAAFEVGRLAAQALLGAIRDLGTGIVDLVVRGGEVVKIGQNFDALSRSIGQSSSEMLKAASAGARGLITDFDLMAAANKGILLGLPITTKEMGTLASAATALGRAMGQDAKKSLDDLILGLGRGSPKILDNLGIMVKAADAYRDYAAANHTTVNAMTQAEKTTAVYTAALTAAEARVKSLGDTTLTTADQIQQFNVVWTNFTDSVAVGVQSALADILNGLFKSDEGFRQAAETAKFVVNIFLNGFVNIARVVGETMSAAGAIFMAKVEMMAGGARTLKAALSFEISPAQAIKDLNAIGNAANKAETDALKGMATALSPDSLTFKDYMKIPAAVGGRPMPNVGGGEANDAEAKKIQSLMDSLSGDKAQAEVDRIATAVSKLGISGVDDLQALGKQLVDLAGKGAKIPDALQPAIQAFAQQAAMKGVPQLAAKAWDEMTKTAESNIKKQASLKIADAKQQEDVIKQFGKTEVALGKQSTDLLQAQLRDGTLSFKQQWELRKDIIISANQEHINEIKKVEAATIEAASHAKDPAVKAALESQIAELEKQAAAWDRVTTEELRAAEAAMRYAAVQKTLSEVSDVLSGLGGLFAALGGSADSFFGKLLTGAQGAVSSIQSIVSSMQSFGTAAASGNVLGMISSGIGIATGVVGAVKSIVGIFHKPEYKKIMSDVGKSWGVAISEGLAKEIEGIAKANKISRSLAELLDVSKIIGESGKDPREFTAKISDLMNAIKSGAVPAAQGLAELGRAFNQVAEAALKSGNIGDKALVGLLKRARELGQVTPEMKEFVGGQLQSAVDGVQKLLDVLPADTVAKAGSSGALLAATFNALAAEQGIVAASAALGPAYDQLMGQITKAGLAIPEALQSIGRQMELGKNKEFQAASGAAAATSQVLTGLGNAGYMDTSVLGASADVAKQAFDQAKNAGATDKEAYQAIGSLLSDIKNASIQSGQEISGLAQELISGAQAEGVVIQGDQLSVLVDIRNILAGGGYTPSGTGPSGPGGGAGGSGAESGGVTGRSEDVFVAPPSVPYRERELRHFAGGSGGVQDFGAGTRAILHGREAVITEKQLQAIIAGTNAPTREGGGGFSPSAEVGGITGRGGSELPDFGSNTSRPVASRQSESSSRRPMPEVGASFNFSPVFMNDPVQTNESRADLSAFQIDEFVRQTINHPLFRQILRDQGLRG